jgi:tRNA(Ser,Leu) C12 N-acetylase TAN1
VAFTYKGGALKREKRVKNPARRNRMMLFIAFQHVLLTLAVFSCVQSDPAGKKVLKNEPQSGEITIRENAQMEPFPRQKPSYVPGQVLVKFKDGVDEQAIQSIKEALSLETIRVVRRPNLFLMRIVNESSVEAVIERLRDFPEVSYAEPNYRVMVH